jgi:beta-phosphoglucomutase-like phosphatase (HAD superfamily)
VRALVFDFDGTILDTEVTLYRAWCERYAERGCRFRSTGGPGASAAGRTGGRTSTRSRTSPS